MDHPRPNLRYVDAKALDDQATKLRGLKVVSNRTEDLGKVEGFIIDTNTGRPYHVVVGTGGLFKHKHFLLPVGHVTLAPDYSRLNADITKDRVERIPGFDKDEFKKLSEEDLNTLEAPTAAACCPDEVVAGVAAWETAHYAYPTWWEAGYYHPDRADEAASTIAGTTNLNRNATIPPAAGRATNDRARERVMASERSDDASPHFDGRAQPGDVLGVETGGERTYVGDTSEDENKRRRDAEDATKRK
jgi:sporulation protein YlmC with PRC-barrel domain